jgi:hypothetical protein
MPRLLPTSLDLPRCPHCGVSAPNLAFSYQFLLVDFEGRQKFWRAYSCGRCAGVVIARAEGWDREVMELFPGPSVEVGDDIPERARAFLTQAIESTCAPSGAVMLAASAVDAMLKAKNLKTGSLFERISKAAEQHLITIEMAQWAHDIRLDANDQRHADEDAALPTSDDSKRAVEFALALAQFMFVLPARVKRGIQSATARDKVTSVAS